jgi:hypothetical protein
VPDSEIRVPSWHAGNSFRAVRQKESPKIAPPRKLPAERAAWLTKGLFFPDE